MQLSCYLFHFSDLKFEDTTGVIRNRKLKKGRQYNGKNPTKNGGKLGCSGRVSICCSNSGTNRVTLEKSI